MTKKKIAIIILLVVAVLSIALWLHCLIGQNEKLNEAELTIPRAMQHIESGNLRHADATLRTAEMVSKALQQEWAAWPEIRNRERTLTSHLANLRVAYAKRLELLETTVANIAASLESGQFDEAGATVSKALSDETKDDQTLQALSRMIERLRAQDFKAAGEAAQQSVTFLNDQVPLSEASKTALPELTAAVEREKAANRATHERIASEVRHLIKEGSYRQSSHFKPVLKGKAMIWDATKNEVEMAYELLPDNLRASSQEGVVTIFSIIRRDQILQGYYSISNQPAYKEKMTIGVVYWPQRRSAGTAIVWGGNPPYSRPVSYHPGYGSSVNIKNWVESLPKK